MQTIQEQKTAAERELAAADRAVTKAEQAFDQDRSDAHSDAVIKCQGKRQLLVDRLKRLTEQAETETKQAEEAAARATVIELRDRLSDAAIESALSPFVEREKVARLELMQVLLERDRLFSGLREACYTVEHLEERLQPNANGPAANTRANDRSHNLSTTVSMLWSKLVNTALERAVELPEDIKRDDARQVALRAVQI